MNDIKENQQLLIKLYEQRKVLMTQLTAIENAIIGFGGSLNQNEELVYPKTGTYEDKIKYVLKYISRHTPGGLIPATEIANFIQTQEIVDNEDVEKLHSTVTMIASSMYKAGKIKARKDGVKNLYYL
jgi:hypothetical protein